MKIGINNIYTSFILLLLAFCGVVIIYFTMIDSSIQVPFLLYPFLWIAIIVSIGVFISIIYNFRFLVINKAGIYCFYPFLFRKRVIKWRDLQNVKTEIVTSFKSKGRAILLNSEKVTIKFSSLKFENFDTLTKQIPNGENILKEVTLSFYAFRGIKYDFLEQIVYIVLLLLFCFVFPYHHWIKWILIPLAILLLCSSIGRLLRLVKVFRMLKTENNK